VGVSGSAAAIAGVGVEGPAERGAVPELEAAGHSVGDAAVLPAPQLVPDALRRPGVESSAAVADRGRVGGALGPGPKTTPVRGLLPTIFPTSGVPAIIVAAKILAAPVVAFIAVVVITAVVAAVIAAARAAAVIPAVIPAAVATVRGIVAGSLRSAGAEGHEGFFLEAQFGAEVCGDGAEADADAETDADTDAESDANANANTDRTDADAERMRGGCGAETERMRR
jgi:hypothetical protein